MGFLENLRSASTMRFAPQLGSQATDCFDFFTAAQLNIDIRTDFWSYLDFHKMRDVPGFRSAGHILF